MHHIGYYRTTNYTSHHCFLYHCHYCIWSDSRSATYHLSNLVKLHIWIVWETLSFSCLCDPQTHGQLDHSQELRCFKSTLHWRLLSVSSYYLILGSASHHQVYHQFLHHYSLSPSSSASYIPLVSSWGHSLSISMRSSGISVQNPSSTDSLFRQIQNSNHLMWVTAGQNVWPTLMSTDL